MILIRYLFRDIFSHTLSVSLIFLFISLSSRSIQYLEEVVKGNLDSQTVIWLILLRMPEFFEIIIPFSFFIAIILVLGRMYAEGELVIFHQNGLSLLRICKVISALGLILGLTVVSLNQFSSPLISNNISELNSEKNLEEKFNLIRPGYFSKLDKRSYIYASDKKDDKLENLFIRFIDDTKKETYIFAKEGEAVGGKFKLKEGLSFSENKDSIERVTFQEMDVFFPEDFFVTKPRIESTSNPKWGFSLVFLFVISGLIAVLMSEVKPRESRYKNVIPALLVYIVYFGLFIFFKESEIGFAVYLLHIVFFLFLSYLFYEKRVWQR